MTSLRKRLEKAWFSLLLASLICIGVSRIFRKDEFSRKQPIDGISTSSRTATRPLSQSEEDYNTEIEFDYNVVFFNRIPKTGSEMLVLLLQWLQGINQFRHIRLPGNNKRRLTSEEQKILVDEVWREVTGDSVPLSFDRHIYFTNFTEYNKRTPVFINIVRDPVDKAVSRYYYGRVTPNPLNPDLRYKRSTTTMRPKRTSNFEDCIRSGDPECSFYSGQPYDLTIPYFCGHHQQCMILNDRWALARAKKNIEEFFPVVGVLEELNATFSVLEDKLPRFFKGVTDMYFKELLQPHKNMNRTKPKFIEPGVRSILENQLSSEYDLYHWIKARLMHQAKVPTS